MRFDESEKLASAKPALKALVAGCDRLLAGLRGDALIHSDRWASALREEASRVDAVLQEYVAAGLLRSRNVVECECGTAVSSGDTQCPSCGLPARGGVPKTAYGFADESRAIASKPAAHPVSSPVAVADTRPQATFGIVIALPYEFAAVEVMLDDRKDWRARGAGAGRRYVVGKIPARSGGVHDVAGVLLPDTGNNQAAACAALLLEHFPEVRHIIMCGIAGGIPRPGVPEHDVRLGDIVITDRGGVIQYDFGKDEGGKWTPRYPPRPPGAELQEATKLLDARAYRGERPWEGYLSRTVEIEGAERPADDLDAKGNPVRYPVDPPRRVGLPRVFFAPIASSGTLLKHEEKRDQLAQEHNVKAVEMEGSGIADATWTRGEGYIVVRGVVDYCDLNKGDRWHKYAAVAAAAYTRALIESIPVA
jgi:nucleoside phosphorylase